MAEQQDRSSRNIKGESDGYIHILISRLTIKPTIPLYRI